MTLFPFAGVVAILMGAVASPNETAPAPGSPPGAPYQPPDAPVAGPPVVPPNSPVAPYGTPYSSPYVNPYRYPPPQPQPPAAPLPGDRTHDGFYLRIQYALGGAWTSAQSDGTTLKVAGPNVGFGLALGGAIQRNLIVYGELFDAVTQGHVQATKDGVPLQNVGTAASSVTVAGLGPGVTYVLPENNVYLSATIGVGSHELVAQTTAGTITPTVRTGGFLKMTGAREWWLSRNWGLGVGGQVLLGGGLGSETSTGDRAGWKMAGLFALASGTYN